MPYTKEYREANAELIKQRQRAANERYAKKHPKKVAKAKADWYRDNRDREIARMSEWKKKNPDKEFNSYLRRKYGISKEQYDELLRRQNDRCAICAGPPIGNRRNGPSTKFDVDHNHSTGEIRGLLCHPCNVLLGQARDRIHVLESAIQYLRERNGG